MIYHIRLDCRACCNIEDIIYKEETRLRRNEARLHAATSVETRNQKLHTYIRTCFLDRRSFFDPQKLFWSITQKLSNRSSYILWILYYSSSSHLDLFGSFTQGGFISSLDIILHQASSMKKTTKKII